MRILRGLRPTWIKLCLAGLAALPAGAAFAQPPAEAPLEPDLVEVSVNGQTQDSSVLLLHDGAGRLYASAAALRSWRIRLPSAPATTFEGEDYYRLDQVPGVRITVSPQDQAVAIQADPAAFDRSRIDLDRAAAGAMTPSATGAYLNYDLLSEWVGGHPSLNGVIETGLFTRHGVGTTSVVGYAGGGHHSLVRLESSWTIDQPLRMTVLRVGDSISSAAAGAYPVRFGGIQFARNFAAQPGFVTMPMPTYSGSAALPSVVDVYVNNILSATHEVSPGPFELTHVPVQAGGGNVRLVVRDLLGREVSSDFGYYASSALLRRGLHDFSYEIGFLRRDFGLRSNAYGAPIALTTQRYGVSDALTVEAHAQASSSVQMIGTGLVYALPGVGLITASAAASHAKEGKGANVSFGFERRTRGLSFGLRSEYASANFAFNGVPDGLERPRYTLNLFADLPLFSGSAAANVIHRNYRIGPDETIFSFSLNLRVGRSAYASLYAQRTMIGESRTIVGGNITFPLGPRRSAAVSAEQGPHSTFARAQFQQDAPSGDGTGYRGAVNLGENQGGEAEVRNNNRFGSYAAHIAHFSGETGVRLSARGSVGLIGGHLFAARAVGPSFAAVEVGRANVRVYADNQLVGVTGRSGALVLPQLRAFERNMIRIDDADLPLDLTPAAMEAAVRPIAHSGVIVDFLVRRENGALIRLRRSDGSLVPAGAVVRRAGQNGDFPVVGEGEVYITGLGRDPARFVATWANGSCGFRAAMPDTTDPQPFLDGVVCRPLALADN